MWPSSSRKSAIRLPWYLTARSVRQSCPEHKHIGIYSTNRHPCVKGAGFLCKWGRSHLYRQTRYSHSVIGGIKFSMARRSLGWRITKWMAGAFSLDTITHCPLWILICRLRKRVPYCILMCNLDFVGQMPLIRSNGRRIPLRCMEYLFHRIFRKAPVQVDLLQSFPA